MNHQPQPMLGISGIDLDINVTEECLDSHTNGVSTKLENTDIFAATEESDTSEAPLKVLKMEGLIQKSNILNLPGSGKELKMTRKLVKVASLETQLLSKEKEQIVPSSREVNCLIIHDMNRVSNPVAEVKPLTQSIQSTSVQNMRDSAVWNGASFIDTTEPKLLHMKPLSQNIQSSSHMKESDGSLHSFKEVSSTNAGSIVPKVLHVKKGMKVIEFQLPVLTQCHTVPNNQSKIVMPNGVGNIVLVPSLPVFPKQVGTSSGSVQQIGAGGSASGMVGKMYQAFQVGSVIQLVPMCNNSVSLK
jgi:hypothetical protein